MAFPRDFVWGAASASYQVEMTMLLRSEFSRIRLTGMADSSGPMAQRSLSPIGCFQGRMQKFPEHSTLDLAGVARVGDTSPGRFKSHTRAGLKFGIMCSGD